MGTAPIASALQVRSIDELNSEIYFDDFADSHMSGELRLYGGCRQHQVTQIWPPKLRVDHLISTRCLCISMAQILYESVYAGDRTQPSTCRLVEKKSGITIYSSCIICCARAKITWQAKQLLENQGGSSIFVYCQDFFPQNRALTAHPSTPQNHRRSSRRPRALEEGFSLF